MLPGSGCSWGRVWATVCARWGGRGGEGAPRHSHSSRCLGEGVTPEWLLSDNLGEFGAESKCTRSRARVGRGAAVPGLRTREPQIAAPSSAHRTLPFVPKAAPPTRALPERVKYLPLQPSCP